MIVFDDIGKREARRKKMTESVFTHLNNSAMPGDVASRALIEDWLGQVPVSEQDEFRSRFRSGDDIQFNTAFQELFWHEFLRSQGCGLVFHPTIAGSSKRPDFLVCPPSASSFILEARTSTDVAAGPENSPRANRIRECLRQMTLTGHRLGIDELTVGTLDLPQKPFRKHITDAIDADPSSKMVRIPAYATKDGWHIRLTAFSGAHYGGSHSSTVMQEAWGKTWTGPSYPLRDALKKKASKYGQLSMPYVIAINSADAMLTGRDFEETLFGARPGITIAGMTDELARGFWGRENNPKHKRVSAVLFTTNLWPATVLMGQVYACLWLNPWADRPYEGLLTELPTFRFENGDVKESPGRPWHVLMNLPLITSSMWG